MSMLTKVFVVLLLLSITFTVMTISIVAQIPDWRTTAEKYAEHARVADTNLRNLIAANAAELATARDAVRAHLERSGALETQLRTARIEAAELQSDLAKADSERSSTEAMNRGLLSQLQMAETARAQYRKQRDELSHQNIDLQRRNIDLHDSVAGQAAQIVVIQEQKRQFEQQINILRQENEKLSEEAWRTSAGMMMEEPAGAAMQDVTALSPVAARVIKGAVVEVDGNIVTISVGSADGVRENMVFVIYRDEHYVGDLRISLVDPNESAGRLVRSTFTPRPGDQVTDARGLRTSRG